MMQSLAVKEPLPAMLPAYPGRVQAYSRPDRRVVEAHVQRTSRSLSSNRRTASSGQPLDQGTREFMESRFGHDFSDVRVHSDAAAARSAEALHALAYTSGSDITFGQGQYRPSTEAGRHLLAHELTHVLQQRAGRDTATSVPDSNESRFEHQAEKAAKRVMAGENGSPLAVTALSAPSAVQRQPAPSQAPVPSAAWSTDLLWIATMLKIRDDCFGYVSPQGQGPYSECGDPIRAPFCQSASFPVDFQFLVDRNNAPRPRPFKPPTITVSLRFVTTSGKELLSVAETDSNPAIGQPNESLEPSFGREWMVNSPESGKLTVTAAMQDSSGVNLLYHDTVEVVVTPCT